MSGENQYINPIIQAMMATAQQGQEKEKLKAQMDQFQQEQKVRELHQSMLEKDLQQKHDLEERHLNEVVLPQLQGLQRLNQLKELQEKTGLRGQGVDINSALGQPNAAAGIPDQPTQQENLLKLKQGESQATEQGRQNVLNPLAVEAFNRTADFERQQNLVKYQQDLDKVAAQGKNQTILEAQRANTERSIANIHGGYQLKNTMLLHQLGLDDGSGQNAAYGSHLVDSVFNGSVDPNKLTPEQKTLVTRISKNQGEVLPNTKDYDSRLNTLNMMDGIIKQVRDLANNHSSDSSGGGFAARHNIQNLSELGGILGKSDLNTKLDTLNANAGQLSTILEDTKRKTDSVILRTALGAFDPKATKQQNLDKLNALHDQLNQFAKSTLVGQNPDRINQTLMQRGITEFGGISKPQNPAQPDFLKLAPQTHPTRPGYSLNNDLSIQQGHPIYTPDVKQNED